VHSVGQLYSTDFVFDRLEANSNTLHSLFWVIARHLNFTCRRFETLPVPSSQLTSPMKMEQTQISRTWAHKLHTPGIHPKERIQHSE
jgi:hypothetical protein